MPPYDYKAEKERFDRVLRDYDFPQPVQFIRTPLRRPIHYSIGEWNMPRPRPTQVFHEEPVKGKTPMIVRVTASSIITAIRDAGIDIPGDARVTFHVPSGGDYSGMDVDLNEHEQVISVRYER